MHTLTIRRPSLLRKLAAFALVLTIISLAASDASAQYGRFRGRGGYYGRGFYGRGYGGFYGPRVYNRGYAGGYYGYGPRFYGRGYGGFYPAPYIAPPVYAAPGLGFGYGYGYGGGLFY
jgi:hypothetical protein